MHVIFRRVVALVLVFFSFCLVADENTPEPESWSLPQVAISARAISPNNVAGLPFNSNGLAYSREVLTKLNVSSMTADELQKYADIVTHAYPDAVAKNLPETCEDLPVKQLNETAIAGIAYVSIHALNKDTRNNAEKCLSVIQNKLSENVQ